MSTRNVQLAAKTISPIAPPKSIAERVGAIDKQTVVSIHHQDVTVAG